VNLKTAFNGSNTDAGVIQSSLPRVLIVGLVT